MLIKGKSFTGRNATHSISKDYAPISILTSVRSKEGSDIRAELFADLLDSRPAVKFIYSVISQFRLLKACSGLVYAVAGSSLSNVRDDPVICLVGLANEEAMLKGIFANNKNIQSTIICSSSLRLSSFFFTMLQTVIRPRQSIRVFQLAYRLAKRYPTYLVLRLLRSLFLYDTIDRTFSKLQNCKSIVVSSEGSPHGASALMWGRVHGIKTTFVSHSYIARDPGRIVCDSAVFRSPYQLSEYKETGSLIGNCYLQMAPAIPFKGLQKNKKLSVLIALSKDTSLSRVNKMLSKWERLAFVKKVYLRIHPHNLKDLSGIDHSSLLPIDLNKALKRVDLLVAGDSNIHLDALAARIPSVYDADLKTDNNDPLPFIKEGLVPCIQSFDNVEINFEKLFMIYDEPSWQVGFKNFLPLSDEESAASKVDWENLFDL